MSKENSPSDVLGDIARNLLKIRDLSKEVAALEDETEALAARLKPFLAEENERFFCVNVYHSYMCSTQVVWLELTGSAVSASLVPAEDPDALEWPAEPECLPLTEPLFDADTGPADQPRLVMNPDVSPTSPVVRGTWLAATYVASLVAGGWTWADILRTHPELTEDDIRACITYAADAEPGHTVNPDVPLIDTEALVAADEAE